MSVMKITFVFACLLIFSLMLIGCKGVKNVSGTLSKSGSGRQQSEYNRDGRIDYTKIPSGAATVRTDTALADRTSGNSAYKRDYSHVAAGNTETLPNSSGGAAFTNAEANERLIKQYAEMDRLAELVVYELNILDRRWDLLLSKYKAASANEREIISRDLDKLNADQLKLYKAHVKIYKEGKADWPATKKEVETALLNVRGIVEK